MRASHKQTPNRSTFGRESSFRSFGSSTPRSSIFFLARYITWCKLYMYHMLYPHVLTTRPDIVEATEHAGRTRR